MECFRVGYIEKNDYQRRAHHETCLDYDLTNTLEHKIEQFKVLPPKQAQRLRLGGDTLFLGTNSFMGSYSPFHRLPRQGLWDDCRIHGCFQCKSLEYIAVVTPIHPSGMIIFNSVQHYGTICFNGAMHGELQAVLPYKPRMSIWDFLCAFAKRLDESSPVPNWYASKVLKVVVKDQCIDSNMWNENCEILYGKKQKLQRDDVDGEEKKVPDADDKKEKPDKKQGQKKKKPEATKSKTKQKDEKKKKGSADQKSKPVLKRPSKK